MPIPVSVRPESRQRSAETRYRGGFAQKRGGVAGLLVFLFGGQRGTLARITAQFRHWKIRAGWVAVLIAVAGLLPLAIAGAVGYRSGADSLRSDAETELGGTAFAATDTLDRLFFERSGDVKSFALGSQARSGNAAEIEREMRLEIRNYAPNYALMIVANRGGTVVAAESLNASFSARDTSGLIGINVASQPWFRGAMGAAAGVSVSGMQSDPLLARVPGLPSQAYTVSFSAPIRSADGRFLGVWSNRLDWHVAQKVLAEEAVSRAGGSSSAVHLYLLNAGGTVIASDQPGSPHDLDLGAVPALQLLIAAAGASQTPHAEVPASTFSAAEHGDDIVAAVRSRGYAAYPGLGWTMLATEASGRALGAASSLRRTMLEIGLAAGALVLLVALGTARFLRRAEAERSRLETGLRQAQKMDAIGRLAGGIAHDFNNLLTVIAGHTELLLNAIGKEDSRRESVEEIANAVRSATAVTGQLLAVSRHQLLNPKVADVNVALEQATGLLERLSPTTVALDLVVSREAGWVLIDAAQLEQVVLNLVINARDAMPLGGRILLESSHAEVDASMAERYQEVEPGSYVLITVSDTGSGIDAETLPHIFEPFFTTKEPGKGTGFGLSTVFGIVTQQGGAIQVYSEVGVGTTFRVYFPAVDPPAKVVLSQPELDSGRRVTILLVEDDEAVRRLTARVLQDGGHTVLEASNRDDAVDLLEGHRGEVALLLTDVSLPGRGPDVLLEALEETNPVAQVVYMSGYPESILSARGMKTGRFFIPKPFTAEDLLRIVHDAVDFDPAAESVPEIV